jgi:hypothetical protein
MPRELVNQKFMHNEFYLGCAARRTKLNLNAIYTP